MASEVGEFRDFGGAGAPRRTIGLLWGVAPKSGKGPRPRLAVADITAAAVALADADGLAGLDRILDGVAALLRR